VYIHLSSHLLPGYLFIYTLTPVCSPAFTSALLLQTVSRDHGYLVRQVMYSYLSSHLYTPFSIHKKYTTPAHLFTCLHTCSHTSLHTLLQASIIEDHGYLVCQANSVFTPAFTPLYTSLCTLCLVCVTCVLLNTCLYTCIGSRLPRPPRKFCINTCLYTSISRYAFFVVCV